MAAKIQKKPMKKAVAKAAMKRKMAVMKKSTKVGKAVRAKTKESDPVISEKLSSLHAFVVNLERRPDRWTRVSEMLKKETPWLTCEKFPASDGTQNPIPEEQVTTTWNTSCNAQFADYFEWVFDAPGTELHGTQWKWSCDAESDADWQFKEKKHKGQEFSYIHHAWETGNVRTATVQKLATKETFKLRLQLSPQCLNPGLTQRMSGGERGCAHSHLRLWKVAADRPSPTLVLEDDVQMVFDRTNHKLGKSNGRVFTQRLAQMLEFAPRDFDVIYLGWSGWRGGNHRNGKNAITDNAPWKKESKKFIREAEYVWTTVAYVISQQGAKKLLAAARPLNQPVDNFMAWEASQGRLNSYVGLDEGDNDGTWAGGIVDQYDFQGDSDIKKSDGGVQGDDVGATMQEFAVPQ